MMYNLVQFPVGLEDPVWRLSAIALITGLDETIPDDVRVGLVVNLTLLTGHQTAEYTSKVNSTETIPFEWKERHFGYLTELLHDLPDKLDNPAISLIATFALAALTLKSETLGHYLIRDQGLSKGKRAVGLYIFKFVRFDKVRRRMLRAMTAAVVNEAGSYLAERVLNYQRAIYNV